MKSIELQAILCFLPIVLGQGLLPKPDLCDDVYIHSADRMPNNTYRVYRDNHYWELTGLPKRVAQVSGPFPIWWKWMAPTTSETAIHTVVGGNIDGMTFKYLKNRFWTWNKDGSLRAGDEEGWGWNGFPKGGFTAALNDGDLDAKGYPVLIAFAGIRVYYFNTKNEIFRRIGDSNGHINGQFNEQFPPDVTAAMAFPSNDPKVKYYVYLFKREEHCYRPIVGEEGCNEWRKNKELFGCLGNRPSKPMGGPSIDVNPEKPKHEKFGSKLTTESEYLEYVEPKELEELPEEGAVPDDKKTNNKNSADHCSPQAFVLLLLSIYLIESFNYYIF